MIASASEWFVAAYSAAVAISVAVLIVLAVRRPLRRFFGAHAAYSAWVLLPAALLGSLLPPPTIEVMVASPTPVSTAFAPAVTTLAQMPQDRSWLWLLLWALGIGLATLYFLHLQRRFVASLGELRSVEYGVWRAASRHGLPALIGLLPPRIVVPADFETRYDETERRLMLAHERTHLRRGDPLANLAFVSLRTLFWFNPLLHLAAMKFRDDQEFACDQSVIASCPQSRRAYADAMLKTLMAAQPVPLGCHWGLAHLMKERLMQLKTKPLQPSRRIAGIALAVALSAGVAFAVWSAQTPRSIIRVAPTVPTATMAPIATQASEKPADIRVDIAASIDGGQASHFAMHTAHGVPFNFVHEDGGRTYDVHATIDRTSAGQYDIRAKIKRDGKNIAEPRLITESGKSAAIRIGEEKPGRDASATHFEGIEIDFTIGPLPVTATSHVGLPPVAPLAPRPPLPGQEPLPPLPSLSALSAEAMAPLPPLPPSPPEAPSSAPLRPTPPPPPSPSEAPLPPLPPSAPSVPDVVREQAEAVAPKPAARPMKASALMPLRSLRLLSNERVDQC